MGKNSKEKEILLKENENELLLKEYFYKFNNIAGEDYAISVLSSDKDIKTSLNYYTSSFPNIESNDIAFILLKSVILSNDKNYYSEVVKDKVSLGELNDIVYLINENLGFRRSLTRTFIRQSNKTNKELYNKLDNKENAIRDLSTINFYEEILKERKLEKPYLKVRKF